MILSALIRELRLHEHFIARDDARAIGGGQRLADAGFDVVTALVGGIDRAKAAAQRQLGEDSRACFLPRRPVDDVRAGRRHYGTEARGATDTPRAPVRSIARPTRPDALASSTKPRRYASPASRPRGTPIACGTFMNWPSSMRAPGSLSTRPMSAWRRPASASTLPLASRSNAASALGARTSSARVSARDRNSS